MIIDWFDDFHGSHQYDFLSNFAPAPVTLGGWEWPTTEHAFQAAKATKPSDFNAIREAQTPDFAKMWGRSIPLSPRWEKDKYDVMRTCLRAKFARGSEMAEKLLATGDAVLVEGTLWNDRVWGVDLTQNPRVGDNWLGTLLMARRAELRILEVPPAYLDVLDGLNEFYWLGWR